MDMDAPQPQPQSRMRPGPIAGGAILLVVGASMLLVDNGIIDTPVRQIIGPAMLMVLGALIIFEKGGFVYGRRERTAEGRPRMRLRRRGGVTGGVWLIGIGAWMLAAQTHLFGLDFHNSWPLFIVLSGIMMLIRGVR
jgi:hypothetical protein